MSKRGPDLSTIAGLGIAIGSILVGQALDGGHVGSILQLTAALIVFGGTAGAVMVSFPLEDVRGALRSLKDVFTEHATDLPALLEEIVRYAQIGRMKGLLSLEGEVARASSPFVGLALRLAVDGTDPKLARDVLETEIQVAEETARRHAKVFEAAGGFAPTVGILGAVLGLIHVMGHLTDPTRMGSGIATAFVATVYGVGTANLLLLPVASKIKVKQDREVLAKTIALEGILAVQLGENPRLIEERLRSFVPAAARRAHGKAATAKAA